MANPSLQIGNDNWAVKEDNLLGYSTAGTRFVPEPITMTRSSAGTRVNPSGLVEDVELLGDEEVINGDFATDSSWVKQDGWTISGGQAHFSFTGTGNRNLYQSPTTSGKLYKLTFEITSLTQGRIRNVSTSVSDDTFFDTVGVHTQYYTSTGTTLYLKATPDAILSIDNVSVKEATKNDLARVDYTDGTSSLLVEPQRTNVSTYSEDFSQSFYIKDSGVSVGTTNNISPSGDANATKIDVTDNGRIYANVASDTYSSSVFIKAGTFAYFKFGGSSVDLEAGTYSGGTIESFGNGWFRITTAYTGNRPFQIQAYPDGTYSSHTTNGNYYIWGAQAEAGSYATSYIPTSGSTVTRNQETYEKTGISDKINSTEGVLFLEMAALQTANTNSEYLVISDGTYNANSIMVQLRNGANQLAVWGYSGSVNQLAEIITLTDITDFNKIAIKWKVNDFEVFVNGSSVYSLGTYTAPTGLDRIEFSRNGSAYFLGKVKQLQVFKTALSDSELATLTT